MMAACGGMRISGGRWPRPLSGTVREQAGQAELSDQLGQRDLPKTGNVDELVERLVEADSK